MDGILQGIYRPRNPQATSLYRLVKDNFDEPERVWDDRRNCRLNTGGIYSPVRGLSFSLLLFLSIKVRSSSALASKRVHCS
jgi:hypothetical protein